VLRRKSNNLFQEKEGIKGGKQRLATKKKKGEKNLLEPK